MSVVILVSILGVFLVVVLVRSVKVVPQARVAIVERFGRYARTLDAGLNVVVPFIERIKYMVDLREHVVPFPPQPVLTLDGVVVQVDTVVYFEVTDPRTAAYETADYVRAIEHLAAAVLRNIIGDLRFEQALAERAAVNAGLRDVLIEVAARWGIRINRVELKAVEPPVAMQESMEKRVRAEYDKLAGVLRAEGDKHAALLQAETEREVAAIRASAERAAAQARSYQGPPLDAGSVPGHLPLRPGDPHRIGRFRLSARLGRGGMGTVYLGHSPGGRLVAVKAVRPELAADPAFRARFAREIDAARRVGGYHTAAVVAADPDDELPWLATEYIPGPSLHDVLRQHGPLPARTVHVLAIGVAETLEGIHACGIVHRDLKPGNIIISAAGPRVIDFGIARALDGTALTRVNQIIGTQGFLAPEQLTGAPVTPAVDLYAFGMVLSLAAGITPPTDPDSHHAAQNLLPAPLVALITRCLSPDPKSRPTPTDFLEHLHDDTTEDEDWLPPPVRTLVDLHNSPTASPP
ncbi:protein kinase domain-containing protein [Yinghuangia soli]|uniref:Protein kinase n=1 Tax=Yinghuangia soli TaxID=2908204 RepID=A0AA41Q345_9ACTN|nr:SPFH domain-containing protein [Yinghuangia soli]MCF2530347.1 protein kinase [Yinghuangia soli]